MRRKLDNIHFSFDEFNTAAAPTATAATAATAAPTP